MTNEPAPLVPPEPVVEDESINGLIEFIHALKAWGRQCAEIAQAQAQRADEAEATIRAMSETAAENSRIKVEDHATIQQLKCEAEQSARIYQEALAESNRFSVGWRECEVTLAQRDREVLGLRQVLENLRANFCAMTSSPIIESWIVMADKALAATAQAGAEAERRVLEAAWERLLAAFPPDGVEGEVVQGAKAAILGTGGEAVDLSKCPKCGGPADNGNDRFLPPNPYFCTKCESGEAR